MERTGGRDKLLSDNRKKIHSKLKKKLLDEIGFITLQKNAYNSILKHSHTFFAFVPHWWASGNPRIDIHPQILFKVSKKKLPVSNFLLSRDQV